MPNEDEAPDRAAAQAGTPASTAPKADAASRAAMGPTFEARHDAQENAGDAFHEFSHGAAPGEVRRWAQLGDRLLGLLGVGFVAAGVIFFFAYNWAGLHRFAKLGVAFGAVAGCIGYAVFARNSRPGSLAPQAPAAPSIAWRVALFGGGLLLGATLALIGQIYQSGADLWQLFAVWSLLLLPLALIARGYESWLLYLIVANVALVLWMIDAWRLLHDWHSAILFCVAAFNALWLLLAERFGSSPWAPRGRLVARAAAFGVIGPLCAGACTGLFVSDFAPLIAPFAAACALMFTLYRYKRLDLSMLGMAGVSAITFLFAASQKLVFDMDFFNEDVALGASISLGLLLIGATAALSQWLLKLHRGQGAPSTGSGPNPSRAAAPSGAPAHEDEPPASAAAPMPTPLWISIVQAGAAWLAMLLIAPVIAGLSFLSTAGGLVLGLGLIGCALACFKLRPDHLFFSQVALAFSVTGQATSYLALARHFEHIESLYWLGLGLALLLTIPRTSVLHRTLCLTWATVAALLLIEPGQQAQLVIGLGFVCVATGLWLGHARWIGQRGGEYLRSVAHSSSLFGLAALWWPYLPKWIGASVAGDAAEFGLASLSPNSTGAALLLLAVAYTLTRRYLGGSARAQKLTTTLLAAAAALALLAYRDPSIVLCAALLLATFSVPQPGWFQLMRTALPGLIVLLYYNMEHTLLARSLMLLGSGALLLALRHGLLLLTTAPREDGATAADAALAHSPASAGKAPRAAPLRGALAATTACAFVLCLWGIWDSERTLAHGQPAYLHLAPADPRSLMQGDYMTLRYEIDSDIRRLLPPVIATPIARRSARAARYAYLSLDTENRAQLHSLGATPELPEGAALAVRLRGSPHKLSIGPNAFFFQEGQAKRYEAAQWAELRVAPSGKVQLANLLDEELQALEIPQKTIDAASP